MGHLGIEEMEQGASCVYSMASTWDLWRSLESDYLFTLKTPRDFLLRRSIWPAAR